MVRVKDIVYVNSDIVRIWNAHANVKYKQPFLGSKVIFIFLAISVWHIYFRDWLFMKQMHWCMRQLEMPKTIKIIYGLVFFPEPEHF